jgi:hypothetical protein
MKTVGIITTALGAALAVFAVLVGVRSVPDVIRYLKIRKM